MGKRITIEELKKQNDDFGVCPKCCGKLFRIWGDMWEYDKIVCSNKTCDYFEELDIMTCEDLDGSIIQFTKEDY